MTVKIGKTGQQDEDVSQQLCYLKALELSAGHGNAWENLGSTLAPGEIMTVKLGKAGRGARIRFQTGSFPQISPNSAHAASAWYHLGLTLWQSIYVTPQSMSEYQFQCQESPSCCAV